MPSNPPTNIATRPTTSSGSSSSSSSSEKNPDVWSSIRFVFSMLNKQVLSVTTLIKVMMLTIYGLYISNVIPEKEAQILQAMYYLSFVKLIYLTFNWILVFRQSRDDGGDNKFAFVIGIVFLSIAFILEIVYMQLMWPISSGGVPTLEKQTIRKLVMLKIVTTVFL